MILNIFKQEIVIIFRNLNYLINQIIFFFITISIFAISFTNLDNNQTIQAMATSVIWFCLIFSILLNTGNFFKRDFENGWLEQLLISGHNFSLIIAVKIFTNWLVSCFILIISFPIAVAMLKLNNSILSNLILTAIVSSFLIKLITSLCSALILSLTSNNSLLTILVLPLTIPIIIFSNSAALSLEADSFLSSLKFLLAILVFLAPIMIFSTAAAIRLNIE